MLPYVITVPAIAGMGSSGNPVPVDRSVNYKAFARNASIALMYASRLT